MNELSHTDKRLLEEIQRDMPRISRPFERIAAACDIGETEAIERLISLQENRIIREISAIPEAGKLGLKNTLVAVKVNPEMVESVAARISADRRVSHNYLREHPYNIWFTLNLPAQQSFEEEAAKILAVDGVISFRTLPSLRTFKIGVHFSFGPNDQVSADIGRAKRAAHDSAPDSCLTLTEKQIIALLQDPFPLEPQPWQTIAGRLNLTESELLQTIASLRERGVIKRIAAVLRHREVGYDANGMACFRLPEDAIEQAGLLAAEFPEVTHCYHRPTYPDWPYSLFAMVHAPARSEAERKIGEIARKIGCSDYTILYSTKEFKKERVKYVLE
jgi:DNA-binding Lrp family transcriptional regulator